MKFLLHRLYAHNFKQLTDVTLNFPASGTILIEGHNEAGKSSIFEAVYFALYGNTYLEEQGLGSLKKYGEDELRVELEFSVGDRRFTIRRNYAALHRVEMEYVGLDGTPCAAKNLSAVKTQIGNEISLTPGALLNTCFVAQKELGSLEKMDRAKREAAINELLNLDIITKMKASFKIERVEYDEIKLQKARVEIAERDADLPLLKTAAEQAQHRFLFAQILQCVEKSKGLSGQIAEQQTAIDAHQTRRKQIAEILENAAGLRSRLAALDGNVHHSLERWRDAETQYAAETKHTAKLQELARVLPEKERELRNAQALAEQLAALESLESEADQQSRQRDEVQAKITAYDKIFGEWEAGTEQQEQGEKTLETLCAQFETAEKREQARRALRLRLPELQSLLNHAKSSAAHTTEAKGFAAKSADARASAERLPEIQTYQKDLETAEERIRERDTAGSDLERLEIELAEREKRDRQYRDRLARIASLTAVVGERETELEAAKTAESTAKIALDRVDVRQAFAAWLEAAERRAQSDPDSADMQQLEKERKQAQTAQSAAEAQEKQARTKFNLGIAVVAGAGLVVGIGIAIKLLFLVFAAGILLAGGAALAVSGQKAVKTARSEVEKTRGETYQRNGQIQQAAAQIAAFDREKERRDAQEAQCRRDLETFGETVPETFDAARSRIAALPEASRPEVQQRHADAAAARHRAESELRIACQHVENETLAVQAYDAPANDAKIAVLTTQRNGLQETLAGMAALPELLATLQTGDDLPAVQERLKSVQQEAAHCAARAGGLAECERQRVTKERQAAEEADAAARLAETLNLPGASLNERANAAKQEQNALLAEIERLPDVQIEQERRIAQQKKSGAETALTSLRETQKMRRKALDEINRPQQESELAEREATLAANAEKQAELAAVRPALKAAALPNQSGLLQTHLAAVEANLSRDQNEAATLPAAQKALQESETQVHDRREAFGTAWNAALPDEPVPPSVVDAQDCLPTARVTLNRQIADLRETEHRAEDQCLADEIAERGQTIAAHRNEQKTVRQSQSALLQALGAEPSIAPETLPAHHPELAGVQAEHGDVYREAEQEARTAVQENRSARGAEARLHSIGEEPLELAAEKEALSRLEKQLAVRKQAGVILDKTREVIIDSVMPLTINNMNRLLPLLTDSRYQQAEWDKGNNSLSIYDNQARGYQRKTTFSGGAKDQISLALRLAFAMATLPGEHCVRPGWLFLDEPLSSFDRQRTHALVSLLTKGMIRKQFDQIFLVSHSEAFDPGLFDHRLRMEGGRVAECSF